MADPTPDAQGATLESPPITPDIPLDSHDEQELASKVVPEPRGEKVVPLTALREERQSKQTLKKEMETLKSQLAALQPVVEQYKQIEPLLPEIAVMMRQMAQGQAPAPAPAAGQVPPEVAQLAKDLEVDVKVAEKLYTAMSGIAKREAGQLVEPITRNVATVQAKDFRSMAYEAKGPDGQPYASREAIDQVFNAIAQQDPRLAATKDVANLALIIARGLDPRRAEPTFSESAGGNSQRGGLSDMDRKAAELRGTSLDKWERLRNNTSMVLED